MRRYAFIFLAAALAVTPALAQPRAPASPWRAVPTAEELQAAYPKDAAARLIGGRVLLACDLTIEGRLRRCVVVAETPLGHGFGNAAMELSDKFRMEPKIRNGQPVEGGRIRFPIVFSLTNQATKV